MAVTKIDSQFVEKEVALEATFTSITAGATVGLDAGDSDDKIAIIVAPSAKTTFTIAVGDGVQGTGDDLALELASGKTYVINIESGRFKQCSGDYKGCFEVTSTGACTCAVVVLP